jgi:hypothetical protein
MSLSKLSILAALSFFTLAIGACAADTDDTSSADDEINRRAKKVSGYDISGPKALPADRAPVEFCAEVVSREQAACERVQGQTKRANGCRDLCSLPIADQGKAAGYDLTGFKQLENGQVPVEFCAAVVSEVQAACEKVQGKVSGANGCAHLCSKPIAPAGKVAGFDKTGFKILANDKVPVEFCAAVVSETQAQCEKVGGKSSRVNGCGDLCSLPF